MGLAGDYFTPETLEVFNNFSKINQSFIIHDSNYLALKNNEETISCLYDMSDRETKFPIYSIYNMNELLSILDNFDLTKTDVEFKNTHLLIQTNNEKLRYIYGSNLVMNPPTMRDGFEAFINEKDVSFRMTKEHIDRLKKIGMALKGVDAIRCFYDAEKKNISLTLLDTKNTDGNIYESDITIKPDYVASESVNFSVKIQFNTLNWLLKRDYSINFKNNHFMAFISLDNKIKYCMGAYTN